MKGRESVRKDKRGTMLRCEPAEKGGGNDRIVNIFTPGKSVNTRTAKKIRSFFLSLSNDT